MVCRKPRSISNTTRTRGRLAVTRLRFGNAGPVQRLKLALGRRMFTQLAERPPSTQVSHLVETPLEEILNAARWAPSGDNRQPWRFELLSADMVAIHLEPPLGDDVYEYRNGEPLLLAGGMLLECLRIAATAQGMNMEWRHEGSDWPHLIVVRFAPAADVGIDPGTPTWDNGRWIASVTERDRSSITSAAR